ncbi:MAG: lysophospholipid acyltransferase family protein [Candidatus Binatia bacterium]|nr:lysophospholipid acyltransferase family protein [Candidatus Binatia bacterium]
MSPFWERTLLAIAPRLFSGGLAALQQSLRIQFVGAEELFERWRRERVILAFWHNRVLLMPLAAQGQPICILTSFSRDGELAARALARWGIATVRGSASRGGTAGFLQLVRAYRRGFHLAVVPDGPRGPRYQVKLGVIHLARATGAAIFPVTYSASRFLQLHSWDRLLVPLPFADVRYYVGTPLQVTPDLSGDALERVRRELEQQLCSLTERADRETARQLPQ